MNLTNKEIFTLLKLLMYRIEYLADSNTPEQANELLELHAKLLATLKRG